MHREIKDLQIPPRWADFLNHGHGYPLFLFTYPFPYYLSEIFHLVGFGLVSSIKIVFILSTVSSGIFMFYLGKRINGNLAGFIAAVLYIYAPFRLVDLYVRGSLGESVSLAIFPLLFLATLSLVTNPNLVRVVAVASIFAILITTHNAMALLFTPFYLAFIFVAIKMYSEDWKRYLIRFFLPAILLGLGLSSYFWLPSLLESKFIILSQVPLADKGQHFVNINEFVYSPWNYGLRPSFQIGWMHLVLFIIEIIVLFILRGIVAKKLIYIGLFSIAASVISVFMMNQISALLWEAPLLSSVDFPWRFMTLLTFFMSLGAIYIVEKRIFKILSLVLIILAFFLVQNFARPQMFFERGEEYYETNDDTTTSAGELMPVWVKELPKSRPTEKTMLLGGNANITNTIYNSKMITIEGLAQTQAKIGINTIYFPGWTIKVNNTLVNPDYSNNRGIITFDIPPGPFQIKGTFERTPIRLLADLISLVSIIFVFAVFIKIALKR